MKKLLAYVKSDWYTGPVEGTPLGWIVLDINSMCPDVKGVTKGTVISTAVWQLVYNTLAKAMSVTPWQAVMDNPFKVTSPCRVRMMNFNAEQTGNLIITEFLVMDEREYYLRCDKQEGEHYEQNM